MPLLRSGYKKTVASVLATLISFFPRSLALQETSCHVVRERAHGNMK